jgi:hypothetical protein
MTKKTIIINNREIKVRILNDDNKLMDVDEGYFNDSFRRIQGDLNFDMGVPSFGPTNIERYTFTTLTDKELTDLFILF